jgi:hypothetical protein
MSEREIMWLQMAIANPIRYKIVVDNDYIWIDDAEIEESVFAFEDFGSDFIVNLLRHIGCDAQHC